MLIALQCHERGIVPERVAGFRAWLKLGRCVRKGETALRVLAPVTVKRRDKDDQETGERCVFFKTAFVFELSQTEPLPGVEPTRLQPPSEPLTGASHLHLIAPLVAFAQSLGYTVGFEPIQGAAGGWCDLSARRIVVDADAPVNARVRTLIHECAHALGVDYKSCSRSQAEVIVDTVIFWRGFRESLMAAGWSVGDSCHRRGGQSVLVGPSRASRLSFAPVPGAWGRRWPALGGPDIRRPQWPRSHHLVCPSRSVPSGAVLTVSV